MTPLSLVVDAIWEGFVADPNVCADREQDIIDTSGWEAFSMSKIAEHVLKRLRDAGMLTDPDNEGRKLATAWQAGFNEALRP